jgi:hypothetical protein
MSGNFILHARVEFIGKGVDPHRKVGLMVRHSLETNSPHINAVVHGDGLTSLQFRKTPGGITEEEKAAISAADVIQLERRDSLEMMFTLACSFVLTTKKLLKKQSCEMFSSWFPREKGLCLIRNTLEVISRSWM